MSWYINIIILKTMQQTRTFFCVCAPFFFFHVTWIPLQSCLPRQSVPSSSRRLCDTFHPQSSSFFPPSTQFPSFLSFACFLSCLSSSDSPPLSELFYVTSPTAPFSASPPVHLTLAPFPFPCIFLSHVLVFALSQARRRRSSWLLSQPSLFTCWPAMEWSCRWLGQSPSLCPSRLTVAWRKMITSLLGDLTRA